MDNCSQALSLAQRLGMEVPGLTFTRDGLEPILQSARTNYLLGSVSGSCGKSEEGKSRFELAAAVAAADQIRWACLAAQRLPGFNRVQWQDRLQSALEQAASRSETCAYPSWWLYTAGSLERELDRAQDAEISFQKALLSPDRMLAYHFTRLARSAATP